MKGKGLILSILFLGCAILLGTYWIGNTIKTTAELEHNTVSEIKKSADIITFEEAAVFLNLTEDELTYLVKHSASMDGRGIPYFKVAQKTLFSKSSLTTWVIKSAENRLAY